MTALRTVVAGTRGSLLARTQTDLVLNALRAAHPGLEIAIEEIRTEGDRDRTSPLAQIGGTGIFVKDLEAALLDGRIDLAVHSLKDMPSTMTSGLTIAAVPQRGDVRDALVTRDGLALAALPPGARIGTGSRRRQAELRALRPDIEPVELRGNVDTRIRRVREGTVDAAVLAAVGLERLGRLAEASQLFSPDELLPAVGQGALAVETRAGEAATLRLVAAIDDAGTHACVRAERAFLRRLGGGCTTPAAAHCTLEGDTPGGILVLRALVAGADGTLLRTEARGPAAEPEALGVAVAGELIERGALQLLAGDEDPASAASDR